MGDPKLLQQTLATALVAVQGVASDGRDFALTARGAKQGLLKGERSDGGIDVRDWRWGMRAPMTAEGAATGRRSALPLTIVKPLDRASTGLMNALSTNETLKEVALSLRKPGGEQTPYLTIALSRARVAGFDIVTQLDGTVLEEWSFAFRAVEVTYYPQSGSGAAGGAHVFSDDFGNEDA